jgi:hypothetical protein
MVNLKTSAEERAHFRQYAQDPEHVFAPFSVTRMLDDIDTLLAAPPPDSAPASGETRVTEEMVARACFAFAAEERAGYPHTGAMRAALEAALASIQPTPAGVDRAGVQRLADQFEAFLSALPPIRHGSIDKVDYRGALSLAGPIRDAIRALQPTAAAKPQSEGER